MTERDPIEALLKDSGRRPGVDSERTRRVRDAVWREWRDGVARRKGRRVLWAAGLAAAIVVAFALGTIGLREAGPSPAGVRVDRVTGMDSLPPGTELLQGQRVATGPSERVALRAAGGHSVRLDLMTALRVVSGTSFVLERGAVYVDSGEHAPGGPGIRIETPFGAIEDRGTRFLVQLATTGLSVRVREGEVSVDDRGRRIAIVAGEAVRIDPSGEVERSIAPDDPAWDWVRDVAPAIAIEGRALGEFLDWAARERGVALRFESPSLAEKARGIELRGSIEGMTFDEAVDSVLATTGLRHRWERDALVVSAP